MGALDAHGVALGGFPPVLQSGDVAVSRHVAPPVAAIPPHAAVAAVRVLVPRMVVAELAAAEVA